MSEKINPVLELAIDSDMYSSEGTLYLGYNPDDDSWDLILRYSGDIGDIEQKLMNSCVYLLGGFAIINIYTENIDALLADSRVLYLDKPGYYSYGALSHKSLPDRSYLYEGFSYEKYVSCINESFGERYNLTGRGVCIGFIDSGLTPPSSEWFADDRLRIVSYWNQNADYDDRTPNRYGRGRIYDAAELAEIAADDSSEGVAFARQGGSTHGNEMASIAAGSSVGVATEADIIMVEQLENPELPDTIGIMMGIDYLVRYSMSSGVPMVINISYGNNFGAHDGTGILELFIDTVLQMAKVSVVTGTGNDGVRELHTSGILGNVTFAQLDVAVGAGMKSFGVQIWKSYIDNFDVLVYNPAYNLTTYLTEGQMISGRAGESGEGTNVSGVYQEPTPYNSKQLVYIYFQSGGFVDEGVWRIRLVPKSIVNGVYNAYLPSEAYVTGRVAFERSTANGTLTIPSTAGGVISVAAYDQRNGALAGFSGRGFTTDNIVKPDIAAPGVEVAALMEPGVYTLVSGTSAASAFVSGCAALLMEWGVVRGNEPFMYGERLKAQLIKGARPVGMQDTYPNRYVGWGAVCMEDSLRTV